MDVQKDSKPETLSAFLRAQTQQAHRDLDSTSFMSGFLDPALSVDTYKSLLVELHKRLAPLELGLLESPLLATFPSVARRNYHEALDTDLKYFSLGCAEPEAPNFDLSTRARVAGTLYVLEGSAMGARIISQKLHSVLGFGLDNGLAYFTTQAQLGMSRWPQFKVELDQALAPAEFGGALDAALKTFQRFA